MPHQLRIDNISLPELVIYDNMIKTLQVITVYECSNFYNLYAVYFTYSFTHMQTYVIRAK